MSSIRQLETRGRQRLCCGASCSCNRGCSQSQRPLSFTLSFLQPQEVCQEVWWLSLQNHLSSAFTPLSPAYNPNIIIMPSSPLHLLELHFHYSSQEASKLSPHRPMTKPVRCTENAFFTSVFVHINTYIFTVYPEKVRQFPIKEIKTEIFLFCLYQTMG